MSTAAKIYFGAAAYFMVAGMLTSNIYRDSQYDFVTLRGKLLNFASVVFWPVCLFSLAAK